MTPEPPRRARTPRGVAWRAPRPPFGDRRRHRPAQWLAVLALATAGLWPGEAMAGRALNGHGLLAQCSAARALLGGAQLAGADLAEARHCLGYVRGITRFATISHLLKPGTQMFCPPPEGIRTREAVAVVVDYLEAHPRRRGAQAVSLAAAAFMRAWPCPTPPWPDGPPPVGLEDRHPTAEP